MCWIVIKNKLIMAIKGIEITSSIPDEEKVSNTIIKVFAKISGFQVNINQDKSLTVEVFVEYHRTAAAGDADKHSISGWPNLKPSYIVSVSEAGWDSASKSPNDALYNKLYDAMTPDFTTLTKVNK